MDKIQRDAFQKAKLANAANGRLFFSRGATRFFGSRFLAAYEGDGAVFVVESLRTSFGADAPRTNRVMAVDLATGQVSRSPMPGIADVTAAVVGYDSPSHAKAIARNLALRDVMKPWLKE